MSQSTDDKLAAPIFNNGKFANPFPGFTGLPGIKNVLRWQKEKLGSAAYPGKNELNQTLPIRKPDFGENVRDGKMRVTWIGHATVLVQMDSLVFITDPIWSQRCSPFRWMGPKRYRDPPIAIEDIPALDFVLISHNHYDHLDLDSVKALEKRFANSGLRWFAPLGLKQWLEGVGGCTRVNELTWGQELTLEDSQTRIICLPAQHWSARGPNDRFKTLWSGWAVKSVSKSFFFAGDSGYCGVEFTKIGRLYGPFDLAAIPIDVLCFIWFMAPQHMSVEDAVQVHKDVRAKKSIGIHWGTFHMGSTEPYLEPRESLLEIVNKEQISARDFRTIDHGETWTLE